MLTTEHIAAHIAFVVYMNMKTLQWHNTVKQHAILVSLHQVCGEGGYFTQAYNLKGAYF